MTRFKTIACLTVAIAVYLWPDISDRVVDWQFQEGHTQEEADARSELVVRAVREAEEHHARKKQLSLSEQAMIVRDLYGY